MYIITPSSLESHLQPLRVNIQYFFLHFCILTAACHVKVGVEFSTCSFISAAKNFQISKRFGFDVLDSGRSACNLKFHGDVSGVSFLSIMLGVRGVL